MPDSPKRLIIGSTEPFSGKSAAVLGIAFQLQGLGFDVAYGKPIATCLGGEASGVDRDVEFVAETLSAPENRLRQPLTSLDPKTIGDSLRQSIPSHLDTLVERYRSQGEDLLLIEGAGTLDEGAIFNLSLPQIAGALSAPILLVARFHSLLVADTLISAKRRLGEQLIGVVINDVPEDQLSVVENTLRPYLEEQHIPVLGLLPRAPLMRSISVREIVGRLQAEVLCCSDRLELMVESLSIGAMNVNSALRYFRKGNNMAVVTGGDRTDIQLAALETSTHCLVLTGHLPPSEVIISRATDLEVPILAVDSDTLTTVERIDEMFGQVQLHEPSKVVCIRDTMAKKIDCQRLLEILDLKQPMPVSGG